MTTELCVLVTIFVVVCLTTIGVGKVLEVREKMKRLYTGTTRR